MVDKRISSSKQRKNEYKKQTVDINSIKKNKIKDVLD